MYNFGTSHKLELARMAEVGIACRRHHFIKENALRNSKYNTEVHKLLMK